MIYDLCGIYPYMIHPWFIHCLPASDVDRLKMDVGRHAPGLAQLSDQHGIFWSCWLWGLGQCDAHVINIEQVSILGCNLQIFIAVCKDVFTFSETGFCWSCTLRLAVPGDLKIPTAAALIPLRLRHGWKYCRVPCAVRPVKAWCYCKGLGSKLVWSDTSWVWCSLASICELMSILDHYSGMYLLQ